MVRLKCSSSISDFYWKSAEITLLQEKPKFASVMKSGDLPGGTGTAGGEGSNAGQASIGEWNSSLENTPVWSRESGPL